MKKLFWAILLIFVSQLSSQSIRYLIITHENFYDAIKPLAQWKHRKGLATKVVKVPSGLKASAIKDTIRKYQPAFVLLVGDRSFIPLGKYFPNWTLYQTGTWTDQYYADTTDDSEYKDDIYLGRLPCATAVQCSIMTNKILAYEQGRLKKGDWLIKASGIARDQLENNPVYDSCYLTAIRTIQTLLQNKGFIQVDTLFYSDGANYTSIQDSVTQGRGIVVYRGSTLSNTDNWNNPFGVNPEQINNDSMPTIVISPTCRTMYCPGDNELTTAAGFRWLRQGSINNPSGATAFWGTTTHYYGPQDSFPDQQTYWRNAAGIRFFQAITNDSENIIGKAIKRAKDSAFVRCSLSTFGHFGHVLACSVAYMEWNLLGDPELNLWTAIPKHLIVTHETIINTDSQNFIVAVKDSATQLPIANALVCIMQDSVIYQYGYTNSSGVIYFSILSGNSGTMSVTVTKRNYIPYIKNVNVIEIHDVGVIEIIQPCGNVDSTSTIVPRAKVKNFGTKIESFNMTFSIQGVRWTNTKQVVNLFPDSVCVIDFDTWSIGQRGTYLTRCSTYLVTDTFKTNNVISGSFNLIVHDIGITEIIEPSGIVDSTSTILPRAKVKNFGTQSESLSVTFTVSEAKWLSIKQVRLESGRDSTIQFDTWTVNPRGNYVTKCSTELANDMISNNNTLTDSFFVRILDIGCTKIVTPVGIIDSTQSIAPCCSVYNYGNQTIDSYTVRMKIGSFYNHTALVSNHTPYFYQHVVFPRCSTWLRGNHVVKCSTELNGDIITTNNKLTESLSVRVKDVGCTKILAPTDTIGIGVIVTPACSVYNYGTTTESYRVRMKIGTFYDDTACVYDHIPGSYQYIKFPDWEAIQVGLHIVTCSTEFISDMKKINDKRTGAVACSITVRTVTATACSNGTIEPEGQIMVEYGHDTTFTITPNQGYHIKQVYVDGDTVGAIQIYTFYNVTETHTIHADFAINSYTITATAGAHGTIKPLGDIIIEYGNDTTLAILPNEGYHVAFLVVDEDTIFSDTSYTFEHVTQDHTIHAEFVINTYTLNVDILGNGNVITIPNQTSYIHGTRVQLTAAPDTGWSFVEWSGDLTSNRNPDSTYMNGDKTVTATFEINTYTVNITIVGSGTVEKNPNQLIYNYGTTVELTANPIMGWHFVEWSGDTTTIVNPITITMNSDKNITATFEINTYTLGVTVIGNGTVTKEPNQIVYNYGANVQLTAIPAEDWVFTGWSGSITSIDNPIIVIMDGNKYIATTFIYAGVPGWSQKALVPTQILGKYVKDGGALTAVAGTKDGNLLYAFRGWKSKEFYMYNGTWIEKETIPYGYKPGTEPPRIYKKTLGKGAALCYDCDNIIYATKGNGTREFWAYYIDSVFTPEGETLEGWRVKAYVPVPKKLKGGTSILWYDGKVYLLAGGQKKTDSTNFYIYNPTQDIIGGTPWTALSPLEPGINTKVWKDGSSIIELNSLIYALKGGDKTNLFYVYDIGSNTWTPKEELPMEDSLYGKYKKNLLVKDGGATTSDGIGAIYAIKGGGTNVFWKYTPGTPGVWIPMETIPRLNRRSVPKSGAALAYMDGKIWLIKGNNTPEFWKYIPLVTNNKERMANIIEHPTQNRNAQCTMINMHISTTPNPCTKYTIINYMVPISGKVNIKLYNATGKIIETLIDEYLNSGDYTIRLFAKNLAKGIYFLSYEINSPRTFLSEEMRENEKLSSTLKPDRGKVQGEYQKKVKVIIE